MVNSQVGKELVPHSQLDDLILLIHQGLLGWVAEDGAAGSLAQKQYIQNCIQRGVHDAWETEHWRAAAAGRIRVSGSRADSNGPWRLALTEMVVRGCRQQQLGKEHCKSGREAFWARVRDIRLMSKIFHDMLHTTRQATVRRRAAQVANVFCNATTEGVLRRHLRWPIEGFCGTLPHSHIMPDSQVVDAQLSPLAGAQYLLPC